jgi:general L-amino acid transport system permease protein
MSPSIPFYRNIRVLAWLAQVAFALGVVGLTWLLLSTMLGNLRKQGIPISFGFLPQPAGFGISEGLPFQPSQSYLTAFGVGVVNTLRAAVAGIILATMLGIGIGVARLSHNWLLERLTTLYVETFRNVPLLLWLVFIYAAIRDILPRLREGPALLGGTVLMSNRGIALAWPQTSVTYSVFWPWLLVGAAVGLGIWGGMAYIASRRGVPYTGRAWRRGLAVCVVLWSSGFLWTWVTARQPPVVWSVPRIEGFNYQGGLVLSPEFAALLGGLVVYTASFIAEIVRAGILAVPRGQREAAKALGLSDPQTFRLVIFPQALRVIIPPLINQYLNLTKNSSLAIAVGYPDLFSIGLTINNQTGQAIPFVVMIMVAYLSMSLLTSLVLNLLNRRLAVHTR